MHTDTFVPPLGHSRRYFHPQYRQTEDVNIAHSSEKVL